MFNIDTKQNNEDHFITTGEAGFTLLMAVIITSVVIMLGVTISGILQRNALISASSKDSTEAFYAADTALECVMYYDRAQDAFGTSSDPISIEDTVKCLGVDASDATTDGRTDYTYNRGFLLNSETICAGITIRKEEISSGNVRTFVEARGRNTCQDTNRRSERALKTAY